MTTKTRYYVYNGLLKYGTYVDANGPLDAVKSQFKYYKILEVKNKNIAEVTVKLVVGQRTSEKYYHVKPDYSKFPVDFQENMRNFIFLLKRHGHYFEEAELLRAIADKEPLELTNKAYGDSHEVYIEDEFGKDYPMVVRLAKRLKLELPDTVWYD